MDRTHKSIRQSSERAPLRVRGWRRLLGASAIGMVLVLAAAVQVHAMPTVTINSVTPNYTAAPDNASTDGTFNTNFRINFTVRPASNQTLTSCTINFFNGAGAINIFNGPTNANPPGTASSAGGNTPYLIVGGGGGTYTVFTAGYWWVSSANRPDTGLYWNPNNYNCTVEVRAYDTGSPSGPATDSVDRLICHSGREVLLPADESNPAAPEFRYPSSGGVTVSPSDGQNDDDGTSSSKYSFRLIYRHPLGLPPRALNSPWHSASPYVPYDDVWRYPTQPDVAVPPTVGPSGPNTQMALFIDTDLRGDGCEGRIDPIDGVHVLGRQRVSWVNTRPLIHYMVPEPGQTMDGPGYRAGTVFTYTIHPTSHEVSIGLPPNTYSSTVSFTQTLLNAFGQGYRDVFGNLFAWRGLRYVDGDYRMRPGDNIRGKGYAPGGRMDAQYTAPFLSLSAGLHSFTYSCTSDCSSLGWDSWGNPFGEVYRYADYNAPSVGTQNQPAKLYPGVADPGNVDASRGWGLMQFHKPFVNPALDTEISNAPGSSTNFEIRIPTPVSVPNPLRPSKPKPTVLLAADPNDKFAVQSTRVMSGEKVRFKVYYSQSENVSPLLSELVLFKKADGAPSGTGFDITKEHARITLQEDPPEGPYNTASGKPFYADIQLPPGEYRYYFRFSDQRRVAQWPGDSGSGTSLTLNLNTSHVANTVNVNQPCQMIDPKVEPAFGRSTTPYTYSVTYLDKNNDPPLSAYLYIGTNSDTITSITTDPGNLDNAIITTAARNYTYPPGTYVNGEIAARTTVGPLATSAFRVVANGTASFTVSDPLGILRANAKNGDVIQPRRRVQLRAKDPTDTTYTDGAEFIYETAAESNLKLDEGTRSYHFEFTDNWGTLSKPELGETVRHYSGINNEIEGPVIQDNNVPQLSLGQVSPTSGTPATAFTYSVRFLDLDNDPARDMQLIIDPQFVQLAPATGSYSLGSLADVTERTIKPLQLPSPAWSDNQWAGKVLKFVTGSAAGRWFVIGTNTSNLAGYTITLVPGTRLIGKGGAAVAAGDEFVILDVTGDARAMDQIDTTDKLYSDGADYAVRSPVRLALGQHKFMFRASDGTSVVYDSTRITNTVADPSTPLVGPDVHVNSMPRLFSDQVIYDGSTAAGATIGSPSTTGMILTGPVAAQGALIGSVLEILQADGQTIRGSFEIIANTDNTVGGPTAVTVNGNPVALGVLPTDKFRIGRRPVSPNVGKAGTLFTWRIIYYDADNDSPEAGYPAFMRIVIDGDAAQTYNMNRVDPADVNFTDGVTYEYTSSSLTTGAHSYFFEANDGANAVRFPTVASFAGPGVNDPPVLTNPTLGAPTGSSQSTYRFEVTYQDPDNDPPDADFPRLVLFDPSGQAVRNGAGQGYFAMTPAAPGPYNYVVGVTYRFDFVPSTPGGPLRFGAYTHRFEASSTGAKQTQPAVPLGPFNGPAVNNEPTLTLGNPAVSPAAGSPNVAYTYRVIYKDVDDNPPTNNRLSLTIIRPDATVLGTFSMTPAANQADPTDYDGAGVIYEYATAPGDLAMPGAYQFWYSASDAVQAPMQSVTVDTQLTPTGGPTINTVPVLSQLAFSPQTAVRTTSFTFNVTWSDGDGASPVGSPKLFLYKPGTLAPLDPNGIDMVAGPGTPTTGILYTVQVPLTDTGTYRYYVKATDGTDVVVLPAGAETDPANALPGPTVAQPVLTLGAVEPSRATRDANYSFRVMYSHAAGVAPSYVRMRLVTPSGQDISAQLPNGGAMTGQGGVPAQIVTPGWLYTYDLTGVQLAAITTEMGTYHYAFVASDGTLPEVTTEVKDGPTSVDAEAAVMSSPSVTPSATDPTKVVYRVTYTQAQNLRPTYLKVVVNGQVSGDAAYMLSQENLADADMTDGAVFAVTLPRPAGSGPHNYYFLALVPGLAGEIQYPTPPAQGPNSPSLLSAPAGGTVTPVTGNTGSRFTFRVRVTDVDATVDPTVHVQVGNLKLLMTKAADGDVRVGADYTVEAIPGTATAMPAGQLVHSFVANDGFTVSRLPLTGNFTGPNVLTETKLNASLSTNQVTMDGLTAVRVTGVTEPAMPSAEITLTYQPAIGTGKTEVVYTDGAGRFAGSFVPWATGPWTVLVTFAGNDTIGGGQQSLALTVDAGTFLVPAGLSMISLPVVPQGDITSVLGAGGYQIARWNGSGYVYGSAAAQNITPGVGLWVQADAAITARALGAAVDHSQECRVPIHAGWNQIGNPFLVPVSWETVRLQAAGVTMTLADARTAGRAYDHAWVFDSRTGQYALVHATAAGARRDLLAWQGVWFRSNVDGVLIFPAPASRSAEPTVAESRNRQRGNERDWEVQLVASNGKASDGFNYAGVTAEGRAAVTSQLESPPMPKGHVDLYFGVPGASRRYATDYRAPVAGEQSWDFVVATDMASQPITVTTPNISRLPKTYEAFLEDVDAGKRLYLRTAGGYTFNPGEGAADRRFRLIVRPRTEGPALIGDITVTQSRGGSAIGYTVSREALVTVEVLSLTGKRLKMVSDRLLSGGGRSMVAWDGTRDDGARLASGAFLVQVTATTSEGLTLSNIKPIVVTR